MLKLTYIETGFHLEYLTQSLEEWVALRVILNLRVSEYIYVEPSTAAFLLPTDLPGLDLLAAEMQLCSATDAIDLSTCDVEYVEVSLKGTWLASDAETAEGIFVTTLSYTAESLLFKLWQEAQMDATVVGE